MKILLFVLMAVTACVLPIVSLAQVDVAGVTQLAQVDPGGFVSCEGNSCRVCDLVSLINLIVKFFFGLVGLIFAILLMVSGFGLVTSGGNTSAVSAAKSKFQNAIIGLIIVMAAWLIVDTVMRGLLQGGTGEISGFGPWSEVECAEQNTAVQAIPTGPGGGGTEYSFTAYTYDEVNSCKIQHTRPFPSPDGCASGLATFRASVPAGNFYLETTCVGTPSGETPPLVLASAPACGGSASVCADDAALMAAHNGSPVGLVDPALPILIQCYLNDPSIDALTDRSQLFTVDRSSPRCSLTNGNNVCGLTCSHSANSKHYGRGSGGGAQAVDFNASPSSREGDLYDLIRARRTVCGGVLNFETNHTHISLP